MLSDNPLNIAVFGLSLRILNELKEKIDAEINVNWTNIADPKLDVLMVSDAFIDAPSIQSLIKNENLRALKLITNAPRSNVIEDNILYLPLVDVSKLEIWLKSPYKKTSTFSTTVSNSGSNFTNENTQPTVSSPVKRQHKDLADVLKEINDPHSGNIRIFDEKGAIAFADPRSDWVWVEKSQIGRVTNDSINSTYATRNDMTAVASQVNRQDLKNWLWNLLWRSPTFQQLAGNNTEECFLLQYWPQPESAQDRYDILRIAACFAQGASIKTVATQLNIREQRVQQFVSACLGIGSIKPIDKAEAKYKPQNDNKSEEAGFMRGFFKKLRSRLGF